MTSKLITTWREYDSAVQEILERSTATLAIFDEDLSTLKLERPDRIAVLRRLLATREHNRRLTMVVQKSDFVRKFSPQLMDLLAVYAPQLAITQSPPHLEALRDSLVIADQEHVLVRFHREHARARLIIDEPTACAPYLLRYEEILASGGDPLSATTLGL